MTTRMKLFDTLEDLARSGYIFRIVDNGGESADRYTIVTCDGDYFAYSANPTHPQGVGLSGENIDPQVLVDWVESGQAVDLTLGDVPKAVADCVLFSINQGVEDFLGDVEARKPHAVAKRRDLAKANEGGYDSFGTGLYSVGEGYAIRLEGDDAADDRGPFMTAQEAVLNTLPDENDLSGPEYQSPRDMSLTTPVAKPLALVAALEAIREYEDIRANPGSFFSSLDEDDSDEGLGARRLHTYQRAVLDNKDIVAMIGEPAALALADECMGELWPLAQERWEKEAKENG